jgi:organic radical activating enzyme
MSIAKVMMELVKKGLTSQTNNLLITGGEPLLQQEELEPLCYLLASNGIRIQIETNGTIIPSQRLADLVTCWVFDYKSKQSFQRGIFNLAKDSYREFWIKYPITNIRDYYVAKTEVKNHPSINHAFSAIAPGMTHNELFQRMKKDKLSNVILNAQLHKLTALKEC